MHEGPGDHQALGLSSRKPIHLVVSPIRQAQLSQQEVGPGRPDCRRHAEISGMEQQVAPSSERKVEVHALGYDREKPPGVDRVPNHVDAGDQSTA
jgi:hypothetical protein